MITLRRAEDRGSTRIDWLDSRHAFSFADYHDPRHMGVSALRVLNEDRVTPGAGFPAHGHRDMEIVSIVLEGAMAHRDNTGGGSTIRPGDVQLMHAGTGIMHSEFNASRSEPLHFLQIWIIPDLRGVEPGYQQRRFMNETDTRVTHRILDPDGRDDALRIHQDVVAWQSRVPAGETLSLSLASGRIGYLQVARGAITLGGHGLEAGDAAIIRDQTPELTALEGAEVILFDLPPA